mgnify:CR=1 FL=1
MKCEIGKVIDGISKYIESEIYSGMNDIQEFAARVVIGRLLNNKEQVKDYLETDIYTLLKDTNNIETARNIINENIPKIENNLADVTDLSMIVLNNYEIDIDNDLTYEDFLLSTHFKKINYATVDIDCLQYKFNSKMYGVIKGNSPLSGSGTSIGAIFTHNGKLIEYDTESEYNPKELILKGIHIDKFFEKDDFHITMYGGIGVGTSEDKVTALLGSGVMSDQYRIYRNNNTTAIFESNDCVVEEIVIFNN